jgi:predicted esterase
MSWTRFPCGFRLDPIAKGSPEALVVILHDLGAATPILTSIAARWATAVPTTSFILLDGIEQLGLLSCGLDPDMKNDREAGTGPTGLDRAALHLERVFDRHLSSHGFDADLVVLVGVGYGGDLALNMVLNHGWGCAGVLAFEASLTLPFPRLLRIDSKVRLVKSFGNGPVDYGSLHGETASLIARGIDTRGVLLGGSIQSDEAVRHGGAYLVELVAHAQRNGGFHIDQERRHAL